MQSQKNELVTQTDAQRSPGLAKPEDFKINSPDANLDYPFGGQNGDSKRECDALLKVREATQQKGKTSSETRNQKELMREHGGSKQVGE